MMPLRMGLDTVWRTLETLEREHRTAASRPGFSRHDDFDDQQARSGRVHRVRNALFFSGVEARDMLTARLSGIDLSTVIDVLLNACKDVAVCWGGSVRAGGAVGGVIGAFAGGVGAVPGAAIGAGLGTQVGAWVLGVLGLKALIQDLGTTVPDALRHYEAGFRMAWGPVRHWESAESTGMDGASYEFARGHVLLMLAMLSALAAYVTRGRGDPAARARILQEIRQSPRLGSKVADWVAANEEALARHPGLKPKEWQVMMSSSAKPPAGPPVTPSQLRKMVGGADAAPPVLKKAEHAPPPKVAGGPTHIAAHEGVDLSEFRRLNVIDTAKGKLAPGEAGAAAELQHYLGGSLERIKTADGRADFVFSSGPHQGKTVDFMFTPNDFSSAAKANQFFEKNLARNEAQLRAHVEKADLVPLDFRFLSEQNQKLFMDVIERLPIERQAQIILLR